MQNKKISAILILNILINIIVPIISFSDNENIEHVIKSEAYYSSLSGAIQDANNATLANADSNLERGVASVIISNDKVIVTLLKDYEENYELQISNNIDINLNGKKLNLIAQNSVEGYGFVINKYKTLRVNGEIDGSEIFHKGAFGKQFIMFQVIGDININGGKYTNCVEDNRAWFVNATDTSIHNINIQNIQLNISAKESGIGIKTSETINNSTVIFKKNKCNLNSVNKPVRVFYGSSNLLFGENEAIVYSEKNSVAGIYILKYGNAIIYKNNITAISEKSSSYGIIVYCNALIDELDIKSISRADKGEISNGIRKYENSKVIIKNSNIVCDSPYNNYIYENDKMTTSSGIKSFKGELILDNVNVKTTDYGVSTSGNTRLYVNGGVFQTYGHGPFYFSNEDGENYIENATLMGLDRSTYDGEFNTENWVNISSCMYMGGGTNTYCSGVSAYLDNCIIDDEGTQTGYFTLRGTNDEKNLRLYISNSIFMYKNTQKFRIDDASDHVYFGAGNTMPEGETIIALRGGATEINNIHNTNEVYKRGNLSYLKLGESDYKDVYIAGDKFDRSNLVIKLINADGTENIITDFEIIDEQNSLVENQENIIVKYNELELKIPINVFSNDNNEITVKRDRYCELDDLVKNISYIGVQDDNVRCIIRKSTLDNFRQSDTIKPVVKITAHTSIKDTEELSKTKSNSIIYTYSWNEKVYGFTEDSITVENGIKVEFKEVIPNQVYTLVVDNDVEDDEIIQNVKVNENTCTDLVGNGNEEITKSIKIDKTAPTCEITANIDKFEEEGVILYTLEWSEKVDEFTEDDITIENGTIENMWQVDNNTYTITVKVTNTGEHKLYITENKCKDEVGNSNNASNIYTIENGLRLELINYREVEENERKYLEKIMPETSIEMLKECIVTNGTIEIYNKKGEKIIDKAELIATGMQIVIKLGNEEKRYKAVVKGDITGDGKMDISDLTKLSRHIAEIDKMTNRAYLKASDVYEKDGKCGVLTDLVKMSRVLAEVDGL